MRLSENERNVIVQAVHSLDPLARIYLFGSRVNPDLKGGDIDLLVLSEKLQFSDKISILISIKAQIGEQKVDLLIKRAGDLASDPFLQKIRQSALEL